MVVKIPKKKIENLTGKGFSVKIKGKVVKGFVVRKEGAFARYSRS
jgi:hypothetical protein